MKKSAYQLLGNAARLLLMASLAFALTLGTVQKARAYASPAPVDLGAATPFVVLTKTGITNISTSTITGNLGASPIDSTAITGFSLILDGTGTFSTSSQVTGKIYAADYADPTPANLTTAVSNMEAAFTDAAGRTLPDATELYSGDLSGQTLAPGLYKWSTGVLINTNVTLAGPSDAVWIFQIAGDLTVGSGAHVMLSGGAQASNIFWQVGGGTGVEIGTTAHIEGTILAAKAIHLRTGATLNGRALAQTAVTLDQNTLVISPSDWNVIVSIGGTSRGHYFLTAGQSERRFYAGVNNGPMQVQSLYGTPIIASERTAYTPDGGTTWTSYSEMMGLPKSQLTDTYYFPWYNNVQMNSQVRFANLGSVGTTVTVTIGGIAQGSHYLVPGQSMLASYAGVDSGPVKIKSSGGTAIVASMRMAYYNGTTWTSFSEMMGLPRTQLNTTYWFPWYNNVDMNTQMRFANVSSVATNIWVTIGGVVQAPIPLAAGQSIRVSYPINNGPVKVESSMRNIVASMRVAYNDGTAWTSFSEVMGLPASQATTTYWFPWYNNLGLDSQLRFANVSGIPATVTVTIGGAAQPPIFLAVGQSTRVSYPLNNGPVKVESSGGNIVASIRVAYNNGTAWTSFSEMMGLPNTQLTDIYYFPWYNNVDLNTQVRFAIP